MPFLGYKICVKDYKTRLGAPNRFLDRKPDSDSLAKEAVYWL